jgi:NAD(P)-dependent dehydrogenase (short-subunit alcohol dehydrogenase family)
MSFMPAPFGLAGSVVAILGAGPGIGSACAQVAAAAGAHIACADIDVEVAKATSASVAEAGGSSSAHAVDVLDRGAVRDLFAELASRHGALHGVVDVVGRAQLVGAADITDEDWSRQLDINLRQQFIAAQESTPHLVASRGSHVAIASINGLVSSPHMVAYGAAKAALISMIRTFAVEYGSTGARFNAIAPGLVRTPHADEIGFTSGPVGDAFLERIPAGEFARPADIGGAAYFLLSALGRHVNGEVLTVDGGSSANYCLASPPLG